MVAFVEDGKLQFGELLATVGIASNRKVEMVCFVSMWTYAGSVNAHFVRCSISVESVRVPTSSIVSALTHYIADDGKTANVAVPRDLRVRFG